MGSLSRYGRADGSPHFMLGLHPSSLALGRRSDCRASEIDTRDICLRSPYAITEGNYTVPSIHSEDKAETTMLRNRSLDTLTAYPVYHS